MGAPTCSDEEFIALFEKHGATELSRILGIATRNVYQRRARLEERVDHTILAPADHKNTTRSEVCYPARYPLKIESGVVLVGSDAHYWPGEASPAHRAFVKFIRELQPKLAILNGDIIDGARISRHPPIGWSRKPTVKEELLAVEERLTEIEDVCASKTERLWTLGNHCMRFENRLAAQTGEFEGVGGFSLKDQFPRWMIILSAWINDDVAVKHRFKGGIHATHNNTLWAGKTIVTGHLHSLKVTPFSDYSGTRWGVDTGTLSNPYGDHSDYTEDNPLNHRSGFIVLTFHKGTLLWPEVVRVVDEKHVDFRGQLIAC